MTTLLSFLGKQQNDYRSADYSFDPATTHRVKYFGLALHEHIKPDRLVLLGTSGSMWDVFFSNEAGDHIDGLEQLIDAAAGNRVDQSMLDNWADRLGKRLGCRVDCRLIPYARNADEQVDILTALADCLAPQENVVLDVTHGFRHLPMLALVAARYLKHIKGVQVDDIYYGALEMTAEGKTPVLHLGGMLDMLDWVDGLTNYDKDGDYGVFGPLLRKDGMAPGDVDLLEKAAFFERTTNPVRARETLTTVFKAVENHHGALGRLFKDALMKRISWFRTGTRADWERSLAQSYLERKDYLRSAIFMLEGFITQATQKDRADPNNIQDRDDAYARQGNEHTRSLKSLRNAMAHGVRANDTDIQNILGDEQKLNQQLQAFRRLIP